MRTKRFLIALVLASVLLVGLLVAVGCVPLPAPELPELPGELGFTVVGDTTIPASLIATVGQEHIGLTSVVTAAVTHTVSGALWTVGDGEIWLVDRAFCQVTTNFDCTGDDCTLSLGDGNDVDGFLALADASLQAAFTEATGFAAGWVGIESGSQGAYTLDDGGPFVYAPSGAPETIDVAIGGTDPAAGAATCYLMYNRIE